MIKIKFNNRVVSAIVLATAAVFAQASTPGAKVAIPDLRAFTTVTPGAQVSHEANAKTSEARAITPEEDFAACFLDDMNRGITPEFITATPERNVKINKTVVLDNSPYTAPMKQPAKSGMKIAPKEAQYISIDNSVVGMEFTSVLTLSKTETDPDGKTVSNGWYVENFYGLGAKSYMTVDESTGEISFPAGQWLVEKSRIMLVRVLFNSSTGAITVRRAAPVVGKINEDGSISLEGWGIVKVNDDNTVTAYNLFYDSQIKVPNVTVEGTEVKSSEKYSGIAYARQTAPREVMFYNLSGVEDVLQATPNANKTISITPQYAVSMGMYGDFFIYNYNPETNKLNKTANITLTPVSGGFTTQGWAVASRSEEANLTSIALKDIKITTDVKVTYPEKPQVSFTGDGSEANPYKITSWDDLNALAYSVKDGNSYAGTHFRLMQDINLSSLDPTIYIPIGDGATQFQGIFDGNSKTLTGLKLDGKGFEHVGIFGYLGNQGEIKNLNIDNQSMRGSGDCIGTIVGMSEGKISNCHVDNTSLSTEGCMTGGIVGGSLGTVENCSFQGNIQGYGSEGGIAGQAQGILRNCHASGNFKIVGFYTTKGRDVGGIAGVFSAGTMSDCHAKGMISDTYGRGDIGGICGRVLNKGTLERCFSAAAISSVRYSSSATSYAGGLTGLAYTANFYDCYSSSTIISTSQNENIGGLTGNLMVSYTTSGYVTLLTNRSLFKNCYYSGQLTYVSDTSYESYKHNNKGIFGTTFVHENDENLHPEDACFVNCVHDAQVNAMPSPKFGRPSSYFSGVLPEGFDASVWQAVPNGYPVLKSMADNQDAILSAGLPMFKTGETAKKVKNPITLHSPTSDINWAILSTDENGKSEYVSENEVMKIVNGQAMVKDQYANSVLVARSKDGWGVKMYRLALVPKWFDGEGTAEDPYQMKNANDFFKLNTALSMYGQTHECDTFKVMNDIDFEGKDNFTGFGENLGYTLGFEGTFDGGNKRLKNLKLNCNYNPEKPTELEKVKGYYGLFNCVMPAATVKNVIIDKSCQVEFYIYSGVITGFNRGRIENCRNYADVLSHNKQTAGIAGVNFTDAVIKDCYNSGSILNYFGQVGGITGYNYEGALIEGCQNDGDVLTMAAATPIAKADYSNVGGIAAQNIGTIKNVVNQGTITAEAAVGGITGFNSFNTDGGYIDGAVATGMVNCLTQTDTRGAAIGTNYAPRNIKNIFFDSSIHVNGAANNNTPAGTFGYSTEELISGVAPEIEGADKFDFTKGMYPVLKNFKDEEASQALRSIAVCFSGKAVRTNVRSEIALTAPAGIKWTLAKGEDFKVADNKLTVMLPTGMKVLYDKLTATLPTGYSKQYDLSSVPVIFKGEGTAENPYLLETPSDWNKLADFMAESSWEYAGDHFKITADLDFAGDSIKVVAHDGVSFAATLDGNNKTIKGYKYSNFNAYKDRIQGPNYYVGRNLGLIGSLAATGTIKNLTVDGEFRTYEKSGNIVGNCYGKITDCVNKATLSTEWGGAAGIAYRLYGTGEIKNCTNYGTISTNNIHAAGITSYNEYGSLIENCYNRGTIACEKGYVFGISSHAYGLIRNCHNEGKFNAPTVIAGICYGIGTTGSLENCTNITDVNIGTTGSNVYGIFYESKAGSTGHVTNCHNKGNFSVKSNAGGICSLVQTGLVVDSCSNTGNMTASVGLATGICDHIYGDIYTKIHGTVKNTFNTGNISGARSTVAGICAMADRYALFEDCYNTGDININVTSASGLAGAGIVSENRGIVRRCFNTGNVSGNITALGGITGWSGGRDSKVESCFNLGDMRLVGTAGNTSHGRAGGISGSVLNDSVSFINCFNAGDIYGDKKIAGIIGQVFNGYVIVENCYNSGRVVLNDDATEPLMSYTVTATADSYTRNGETAPFYKNFKNVYYDSSVNTGKESKHVPGSEKTTAELQKAMLGEAFEASAHGGYPVLSLYKNHPAAHYATAMIGLSSDKEHHGYVTDAIALYGPTDAVWTSSDASMLEVNGTTAKPKKDGNAILTCSDATGKLVKTFALVLKPSQSSLDDIFAGKEVKGEAWYDLNGRTVTAPQLGNVYIHKTLYTDGTINVKKITVK